MPKLTDTQLVILSAAAARDDGAVLPLPDSLRIKGGAVTTVLESLLRKHLIAEMSAAPEIAVWCETEGGEPLPLAITDAGLAAIGIEPENTSLVDEIAAAPVATEPAVDKPAPENPKPRPRTGKRQNKTDLVLDLVRRPDGASIAVLQAATGWQPHSIRAALTGLRKRGHAIIRDKPGDGETVYRLAGGD